LVDDWVNPIDIEPTVTLPLLALDNTSFLDCGLPILDCGLTCLLGERLQSAIANPKSAISRRP